MLGETLLMALREIRRNALRSFLTMLGVVIGVGAVIVLVTLGEGASAKVKSDIAKLGENLLIVNTGAFRRGPSSTPARPFTREDAAAVVREVGGLSGVAPAASRQTLVVYGNRNWRTQVSGSTADFFPVRGYQIQRGRAFTASESTAGRALCVVGQTVVTELFGGADPLGQTLRVGRTPCEVIGTLVPKGEAGFGQDQDDLVVMPLVAFQRRIAGNNDITSMYVSAAPGRSTALVQSQLESLLRERRRITNPAEDDFTVRDMAEIAATMASTTGALAALLGAIAGVSLLVGGIGIMNIMLVSVTERTREIGLRLAVGARPRDILGQFLIEATTLATIGGAIGVALGVGTAQGIASAAGWPALVSPNAIVVAVAFSALVGIFFGFYPAQRAAQLDPIEALRRE
jgi:putative ABC transport system permease protein